MIAALRRYNERALRDADWREEIAPGIVVGERARPIASAALYVPSGKGSFPSVMAHLGVPAVVAGVPNVVVLCPPLRATGRVDPAYLYVAAQLGLREVWRVNGPSGIAAAVLGTSSIPRVRKVVGPGSPAVTVAQLLAAEHGVATNMLQGPSESLIIADDSADPRLLALDLLTEAEHGTDSAATLLTWSPALAESVADALEPLLAVLPELQRGYAASVLGDLGGILICADEAEACAFANEYAVEHLQIATADPEATLARIDYAAEILIGQTTPMAAANFTIGVPNTLPSGGYAAVSSGVTARTFLTTSSTRAAQRRGPRRRRPGRACDRRVRAVPRARARTRGARTVSEREVIALMPTCLVDLVRPEAGVSAVRVLRRAGYRVTFPEGQTCCGQPAWNSGFPDDARRVAATTLAALAASEGPIVVLSGSCAATMLHAWPELFAGDPRVAGVLERVVEFGAFLAPRANTAPTVGARRPVAFHCSCHQRRGLRDTTSGTTLISSLPNVELVEQADADACCGFGGTFAVKFPGVSTAMGRDKVDAVHEAGAGELVSGDLGCLMHLAGVAAENDVELATTTLPELLDREGWMP